VQVSVSRKNNWEQGQMTALQRESAQRVRPGCPHFGLHSGACGGCKMQHLHPAAQVAVKQRVLEDNLWHLAKVRPERLLRAIEGPAWGYRDRARLSVRWVAKKGTVLIGFHERKSRYVADMRVCPVLPAKVSAMLMPLRELIGAMDQRDRCRRSSWQRATAVTALVLRHLEPLTPADLQRLRDFAPCTACSGGCSPRARTRCTCWTKAGPRWPTACPNSASPCLSSRPTSRRSTRTSTACWWIARCACWRRRPASA
jgi:23S rRNA (uracil1939-C5)-methyltransferase